MTKKWLMYVVTGLLCCGIIGFAVANQGNIKREVAASDQIRIELRDVEKQMQINGQTPELIARRAELNALLTSLKMPSVLANAPDSYVEALDKASSPVEAKAQVQNETKAEPVADVSMLSATAPEGYVAPNAAAQAAIAAHEADNRKATFEQLRLRIQDGIQLSNGEKELYTELEEYFAPRERDFEPLDAQGGPDGFGYVWVDNVAPDTVAYNFVELCNDPAATIGPVGDDSQANANIGFSFPFYGTNYTTVNINTNGQLSLGSTSSSWSNVCLNTTTTSKINVYWDDLVATAGTPGTCTNGTIYYKAVSANLFIVQWNNVDPYSGGAGLVKVQAQLSSDGKIKIVFHQTEHTHVATSATVGIETTGTNGLEYRCNNTGQNVVAGTAVVFYVSAQAPTGRCCYTDQDPCTYNCIDDQTPAECATLGGVFSLGLTCATACPTVTPGETAACPIPVPALPYSANGSSCTFANNYDEVCPYGGSTAPDVVYAYTPVANVAVDISLCTGTTNYDTKLYVYQNTVTPGAPYACNDDACTAPNYASPYVSLLEAVALTAGNTYYIVVDGYGSSCGNYTLTVTTAVVGRCCYNSGSQCQNVSAATCASLGGVWDEGLNCTDNPCVNLCELECGPFDIIELASVDSCQLDSFDTNGGCNNLAGPLFQQIACGDTICGSTYTYVNCDNGLNSRDTDWYEFTITEEMDVTWNIVAEFNDVLGFLISGTCQSYTILGQAGGFGPCGQVYSITVECLLPGTYWAWAGPNQFTGLPFQVDHQYRAWLQCTPCVPPVGRCCYENGASCAENTLFECNTLGGAWTEGLTCATPCPLVTPGGDNCATATPVAVPGTYAGTTVGLTDLDPGFQCALGSTDPYEGSNTAPDAWYSITGTGNTMTVTLCDPATLYDTQILVVCTDDCSNFNCIAGNDDDFACTVPSSLRSTASFCSILGQEYFVVVDGWGGGNGEYSLTISDDGIPCANPTPCVFTLGRCCYNNFASCDDLTLTGCNTLGGVWDSELTCATPCENPCALTCGPNDVIEPLDALDCVGPDPNGGCNSVPPSFQDIDCGDTICAEAFTCDAIFTRDTDWFRFVVTEEALVTVSVSSEFNNLLYGIVNGIDDCLAPAFVINGFVTDCAAGWVSVSAILQPGNYAAFGAFGAFNGLPLGGSNTYRITVNGCAVQTPCDPVPDLTIHVETVTDLADHIKLFWTAPQDEDYKVWSTTFPDNDGNPDDGADPQWTLEATLNGLLAGPQTWDAAVGFASYMNFVVTGVCEPYQAPTGRCCYGNFECADVTEAECDGLSGTWSQFMNCTANPCPPPPPANDDCGNAIQIFNGTSLPGYTTGAALGTDVTSCAFNDLYDVWYYYVSESTAPITATVCEATYYYDTALSIWSACGGTEVACNDDNCALNSLQSTVSHATPAQGTTYYIRVSGYNNQTGNFNLLVTQ